MADHVTDSTHSTDPDPGDEPAEVAEPAEDARPDDPVSRDRPEVTLAEINQAAALAGSRVERLVEEAIEVELTTGRHEETIEEAKRHLVVRIVRIVAGVIVLIIGLALLVAPGPGLLAIALGLGLLAQDVPFAAKLLDRVKARLPQDEDGKLPTSTIVMMVVVGVAAGAASLWWTFGRG